MSATPKFAATPNLGMAQVATANTARDGTGTVATLLTAGSNGTKVENIEVVAAGTVSDGVVRVFLYNGTTARLYKEIMVTATTPSTTVEVFRRVFTPAQPLVLPSGWSIQVSTHVGEAINVFAEAADL